MKKALKIIIAFFLLAIVIAAQAASMMDGFTDPEDGMFDVSHWLAEKKGFSRYLSSLQSQPSVTACVQHWCSCMIHWLDVYLMVKPLTRNQKMLRVS